MRIAPGKLAAYKATTHQRQELERQQLAHRCQQALEVARCAATLLKERFGASRVVLFGSVVREDLFTRWSDVDIAAWGIPPGDTFKAVAALMGLDEEIEINLMDIGTCRPAVLASIERDGIEL